MGTIKKTKHTHHIHIFEDNKFELFLMKQTNDIEKQNLSIELNFLLNISYFNSTDIKIKKTYVDLDMTCDTKFDSN